MLKEHFIDLLGPLYMMGNPGWITMKGNTFAVKRLLVLTWI